MTNSRTIIVVDDEAAICQILSTFLSAANYEVICFTSPREALVYLTKNNSLNLLLTDMQMPEMTGLELVRQVKTLYPAIPIIVMSGAADGQDREEIFSLGADFIPKPFDLADLLKRIESPPKAGPSQAEKEVF